MSEENIVEKVLNSTVSEKQLNRKEHVMDMTEGNSLKLIMKFSIPLLIGNLFQQVYSVVDSVVVGRHLGANALGGVGSVGMMVLPLSAGFTMTYCIWDRCCHSEVFWCKA